MGENGKKGRSKKFDVNDYSNKTYDEIREEIEPVMETRVNATVKSLNPNGRLEMKREFHIRSWSLQTRKAFHNYDPAKHNGLTFFICIFLQNYDPATAQPPTVTP